MGRDASFDWAREWFGEVAGYELDQPNGQFGEDFSRNISYLMPNGGRVSSIVADGEPGELQNVGVNFTRAALTAKENIEAAGFTAEYFGPLRGFSDFQALLDKAAELGVTNIFLFTHGDSVRLLLGDGAPNDINSVTMTNVNRLINRSKSLVSIHIYGCNTGKRDNGIAAALAKRLNVWVHASTTGMSFSSEPGRIVGPKIFPNTGPAYMVPEGKGKMRAFPPL